MVTRANTPADKKCSVLPRLGIAMLTLILIVVSSFAMGQATYASVESNAAPAVAARNTPTPVMIPINPGSVERSIARATPTPKPRVSPAELKGMILFLSDIEPADEEGFSEDLAPGKDGAVYVLDPATGQISRLSAPWPYYCAAQRDAFSADQQYRALVQFDRYNDNNAGDSEDDVIEEPTAEPIEDPFELYGGSRSGRVTLFSVQGLTRTQGEEVEEAVSAERSSGVSVIGRDQCGPMIEDDPQALLDCDTYQCRIYYYDHVFSVCKPATFFGPNSNQRDDAWDPVWSPAGDQVAFVSNESGNDEIYVVTKDRWPPQRVTTTIGAWDKHPSWSPDGTQIVFMSSRTGSRQLWLMNADGTNQRMLTKWAFEAWDPVWVKYIGKDGCQ